MTHRTRFAYLSVPKPTADGCSGRAPLQSQTSVCIRVYGKWRDGGPQLTTECVPSNTVCPAPNSVCVVCGKIHGGGGILGKEVGPFLPKSLKERSSVMRSLGSVTRRTCLAIFSLSDLAFQHPGETPALGTTCLRTCMVGLGRGCVLPLCAHAASGVTACARGHFPEDAAALYSRLLTWLSGSCPRPWLLTYDR